MLGCPIGWSRSHFLHIATGTARLRLEISEKRHFGSRRRPASQKSTTTNRNPLQTKRLPAVAGDSWNCWRFTVRSTPQLLPTQICDYNAQDGNRGRDQRNGPGSPRIEVSQFCLKYRFN